jgi:hypothetical protein
MDIHTLPHTTVTATVTSIPCMPLTEILQGILTLVHVPCTWWGVSCQVGWLVISSLPTRR